MIERNKQKCLLSFHTALANICNVTLMRYTELWEGIEVTDSKGNVLGTSKIAAKSVSCLIFYLLFKQYL